MQTKSCAVQDAFRSAMKWPLTLVLVCPRLSGLQDSGSIPHASENGASAIWIFANLSFTGMRAQNQGGTFWKVVTFILGFPGTLLTLFVVTTGSERAYGVDLPRKR